MGTETDKRRLRRPGRERRNNMIPNSNEGVCACGHVEDEHDPHSGSCTIKDCLCAGFEPDDQEE